jgi:FkbM family methyltransferase
MRLRNFDMSLLRKFQPRSAYLGDHTALALTRLNHKIYVDTRDISITPHILMHGAWENWLARVMVANFRPAGLMLDAGANVGYHTLLMAEIGGPAATIIAVEANPDLAELIRRTVAVNGFFERVEVHAVALGDKPGMVELKIYDQYKGSSSLVATDEAAAHFGDRLKVVPVPMKTLDELTAGRPLSCAKIDCEGAEPLILAGARETLARSAEIKMVLEFSPAMYAPGAAAAMLDIFEANRFLLHRVRVSGALEPVSRDALLNTHEQMDLMISRGAAPISAERKGTGLVAPFIRAYRSWRDGA